MKLKYKHLSISVAPPKEDEAKKAWVDARVKEHKGFNLPELAEQFGKLYDEFKAVRPEETKK